MCQARCSVCHTDEQHDVAVYTCPDCGSSFCTDCKPQSADGRCPACEAEAVAEHQSFLNGIPVFP